LYCLIAVAHILGLALTVLYWLVLVRALVSWVNPDPYNFIVQFLYKTTEPILEPIRRVLPAGVRFGIDISPIIAFIAILFVKMFLVQTLLDLAVRVK